MYKMLAFATIMLAQPVQAQIIVKGPTEAKSGTMQVIVLTEVKGKDLKIEAFQAGESTKVNWHLFKNIEEQFVVMVLPQPGDTIYNFVFAINNADKTYLSTHTMRVNSAPEPVKPLPVPVPVDPLESKLKALYQSSPDVDTLNKLIVIFDQVVKLEYENQDQMQTVLKETAKTLPADKLRTLRDAIGDNFIETLGTNPKAKPNLEPYRNILKILKRL